MHTTKGCNAKVDVYACEWVAAPTPSAGRYTFDLIVNFALTTKPA